MQEWLMKAISEEEYENAAALRDQIRGLENHLNGEAHENE